jgi:peptidoglycan/xylan/chitin deacetylase (PgdA/CDA1 family)
MRHLTRRPGLRCVLYHEIAESTSAFTEGLGITISPDALRRQLESFVQAYDVVAIDHLAADETADQPSRPQMMVTFDDAYASVPSVAADICHELGIRSTFFVNGAYIDNRAIALDNLVAWTINTHGMAPVEGAAGRRFKDRRAVFDFRAGLTPIERSRLVQALAVSTSSEPARLASEGRLYATSQQLASLPAKGMTIGNHTWSHVHTRVLTETSFGEEIDRNRAFLESIIDDPLDVFSYPYGSRLDATHPVTAWLTQRGYRAAFLVEAQANHIDQDPMKLFRVSLGNVVGPHLNAEVELLPVLRRLRDLALRRRM